MKNTFDFESAIRQNKLEYDITKVINSSENEKLTNFEVLNVLAKLIQTTTHIIKIEKQ